MSAVTSIILADALGTPVNHTFIPLGPDAKGVWWFEDQSQANPIGYWKVSIEVIRAKPPAPGASASDRVSRVRIALHQPTLETMSNNSAGLVPAPQVAYILRSSTEYILSERSSLQNRKDLRKMTGLVQGIPMVVDAVETLQNIY